MLVMAVKIKVFTFVVLHSLVWLIEVFLYIIYPAAKRNLWQVPIQRYEHRILTPWTYWKPCITKRCTALNGEFTWTLPPPQFKSKHSATVWCTTIITVTAATFNSWQTHSAWNRNRRREASTSWRPYCSTWEMYSLDTLSRFGGRRRKGGITTCPPNGCTLRTRWSSGWRTMMWKPPVFTCYFTKGCHRNVCEYSLHVHLLTIWLFCDFFYYLNLNVELKVPLVLF